VNNAGGGLIRPFLSHTVETLEETLRRNLWTVLLCTHAALPSMVKANYGRIVTSVRTPCATACPRTPATTRRRAACMGLTTGLAREFAFKRHHR